MPIILKLELKTPAIGQYVYSSWNCGVATPKQYQSFVVTEKVKYWSQWLLTRFGNSRRWYWKQSLPRRIYSFPIEAYKSKQHFRVRQWNLMQDSKRSFKVCTAEVERNKQEDEKTI